MKTRVKIKITQKHIDKATPNMANKSPVSLACAEIWPNTCAAVAFDDLWLDGSVVAFPYYPSLWIGYWNDNLPVKPTEFVIMVPLLVRIKLWWKNLR